MMLPLKRPDLECFIPESEVIRTGSHGGIFDLSVLWAKEKLGDNLKMVAHQPAASPVGYIVYAWADKPCQ